MDLYYVLRLNLTDMASDGPGWYLYVRSGDQTMVEPVRLRNDAAEELAGAFQSALHTQNHATKVNVRQLAASGSKLIHEALEKALRDAERAAAAIPSLRQRLGQIPPNDPGAYASRD